jgi:hypothetical protein
MSVYFKKIKTMKNKSIIILCCAFFMHLSGFGQSEWPIYGSWAGKLSFQGQSLRMVFHIEQVEDGGYKASIDSPDQGAYGLNVQQCEVDSNKLVLRLPNLMATFEGIMVHPDTIIGTWKQAGLVFDLLLLRQKNKESRPGRPQEPVGELPYRIKEVSIYQTSGGFNLAATITIPPGDGPFPAAVLISGSGPQNRDEEIMGHKPFLVLADFLARNGIMTLRYDDRGTAGSGGDFAASTTYDFSNDAEAAWSFLRSQPETNAHLCGMIGHSEGGMIAPIVAARNPVIGFLVLMAAPGTPTDMLLLKQARLISEAQGASEKEIRLTEKSNKEIFRVLKYEENETTARKLVRQTLIALSDSLTPDGSQLEESMQQQLLLSVDQLFSPWFLNFIRFDPAIYLKQVKCPVLAINGSKDRQVPAAENLDGIEKNLKAAGNDNTKIVLFDGLNHLFQTAETGSPAEYATIEETLAPQVMQTISDWIQTLSK